MSGDGGGRSGRGGRTKSGKPRPGTGGYGRRKLEGKGPTPAAEVRPGHPAQRRAAAAAAGAGRRSGGTATPDGERRSRDGSRYASQGRGSGSAAEIVAGRNAVLEALRAGVPAVALHVGPRLDSDERIGEAIKLAADAGITIL
jgi:23S rRNA (guanosine2251-2'-O)-methyltransferase